MESLYSERMTIVFLIKKMSYLTKHAANDLEILKGMFRKS